MFAMQKSTTVVSAPTTISSTIPLRPASKVFAREPDALPEVFRKGLTRRLARWAVGAAIALVAIPAALAQPSFFVTELPTPAGYDSSAPSQINDQGFVVGASQRGS